MPLSITENDHSFATLSARISTRAGSFGRRYFNAFPIKF